jgi:choline dehydrogenase-like flavoprotein
VSRVLVVGSGASGVHFCLTGLKKGHEVTLLDVGYTRPEPVLPGATFQGLKAALDDPVSYFLGEELEGVVYPATKASYYGHPPSKNYVFRLPPQFSSSATLIQPVFSFARGGLAEAWTAGVYPFNGADLAAYPFGYEALRPHYQEVAHRIGIGAERDDLERFIPFDADYLEPLPLDLHSSRLMEAYQSHRSALNRDLGFYLGRSRVATLSRPFRERPACDQLGRCLWGCPTDAIYSPRVTLRECLTFPNFRYLAGTMARRFEFDAGGRITRLSVEPSSGGTPEWLDGDLFVLAAGALCSSKIYLDSLYARTGKAPVLTGLMDNRQIHVPFLTLNMIGQPAVTAGYQFHHLAFGIEASDPAEYVHGQITTLKAASVHPIVASMPVDLRSALAILRTVRAGLGIANINLHDRRREDSCVTVRPRPGGDRTELVLDYRDPPDEPERARRALKVVKRALGELGCLMPPGMTRVLPKGASVHYSGTLPMSATRVEHGTAPDGRSWQFENLLIVDGAGFPALPAKNLTFTLMANAVRVAEAHL